MHDVDTMRVLWPVVFLIGGLVILVLGAGCALVDSGTLDGVGATPRACGRMPDATAASFRHTRSRLVAKLGDSHHRGIDLIATSTAPSQVIEGKLAYGKTDKDLEDEDVDIFVCGDATWQKLGTARSDDEGRFRLELAGAARLPLGLHDLALSVVGDGSRARFVALVALEQAPIIVSDVDGTITASEKAFYGTVVFDTAAGVQPDAAAALVAAAAAGVQPVYVTARGGLFTEDTRRWLAAQGFPKGPIRFTPDAFVLPGDRTVAYKTTTLEPLAAAFTLVAGLGNRASDIAAYTNVGLAADRIFIKLPEFTDELAGPLAAKQAVGFAAYQDLLPILATL